LLANLLRINQIPLAYIPPEPYQQLRDLTRDG
jgi:transposase